MGGAMVRGTMGWAMVRGTMYGTMIMGGQTHVILTVLMSPQPSFMWTPIVVAVVRRKINFLCARRRSNLFVSLPQKIVFQLFVRPPLSFVFMNIFCLPKALWLDSFQYLLAISNKENWQSRFQILPNTKSTLKMPKTFKIWPKWWTVAK